MIIYVYVHICCWWLYMLGAYMLLVIIYVYVHICCWWISLTCYWWWIVGVSMYWTMLVWICGIRMKYVLLLSSPKFTHSCCWISSPCWWRILMYSIMRGDYDVFVASGATTSEMKLVPHVSRVGLDTLHVLGWVVFAYVLDANYVLVYCVLGD